MMRYAISKPIATVDNEESSLHEYTTSKNLSRLPFFGNCPEQATSTTIAPSIFIRVAAWLPGQISIVPSLFGTRLLLCRNMTTQQ